MDEMYNVLSNAVCQRKTQISFLLVNNSLYVPLGNLLYESFKVCYLIAETFVVILLCWPCFGSDCLDVSAVKRGVDDDCLRYDFDAPEKIEGCCVGYFPLSLIIIQSQSKWWWQIWISFSFWRYSRIFGIASIYLLWSLWYLRNNALTVGEYSIFPENQTRYTLAAW